MRSQKRLSFRWIPAMLVLVLAVLAVSAASATDWTAEARSMLKLINDFRTGGNAWYWNSDNKTWTTETGLGTLQYDPELEEVAKVRAQELTVSLSHTRPNGQKWSTAYPAGNYYKGENIACGFFSAEDVFNAWMEEDCDYEGQGHRRNMLKRTFTRVGIAAVEANGTVYWVQEFASGAVKGTSEAGWVEKNGTYYYYKEDGTKATGWLQDGDDWYYLNKKGAMQTGWQTLDGTKYHFSKDGAMQTGWIQDGSNWYYLDNNGAMQTGWVKDGKDWYYLDKKGTMQTGWIQDGGKWYHLNRNGILETGWIQDGGDWFYTNSSGVMQTGWKEIKGDWYYFRSSGAMVTGTQVIDGNKEYFSANGVWQASEIQDYDTPLGIGGWQGLILLLRNLFRVLLSPFN